MTEFTILFVDDEAALRRAFAEALPQMTPHRYRFAADGVEAMEIIRGEPVNLVLTDLQMPRMTGEQLLKEIQQFNPELPVIVVSSHGTISTAVDLLKKGAYDYIAKPFKLQELVGRVELALNRLRLIGEIKVLRQKLQGNDALERILGNSPKIVSTLKKLPSIARSDASVIIYGESGTGKELAARAIHALSPRAQAAFVAVDCGALPEALLENELFGHVRGAFTDAHKDQAGLIHEADQGTLFLDEIGEISPAVQAKLLRFLQEKEYRPLGSSRNQKANVRIVTATNKDLKKAVSEGKLREDLFYRLNIIPVTMPPLRERKGDVPLLANYFLTKASATFGKSEMTISPTAMQRLTACEWPGNIRELENKIQQLVALSETTVIMPEQVDGEGESAAEAVEWTPQPFKRAKAEIVNRFEVDYIRRALALHKGNVSRAARESGKHRRAFWALMKKHGISGKP